MDLEGNIFGDYEEKMDLFNGRWEEGLLHLCNYNGLVGLRGRVQKEAGQHRCHEIH